VRTVVAVSLLVLLGGCASRGGVTLLPGEDGAAAGAVVLLDAKTQTERGVIDQENTRAGLRGRKVRARQVKADRYTILGYLMPPKAHHFTVYFLEGSTTLAPGSEPVLDQMFKELTLRGAAEVEIIGHTDTVGSDADNDALSLKRAKEVRDALVATGRLDISVTSFAGRGERDPLVATADNVEEPRNRRVEIVVR
jgi:outer membrane protein OmpA-like peptidoglycan-associated protein